MNKNQSILYQVAFKEASALYQNRAELFETDDTVGEVIGLTDAFFEVLAARTGEGGSGNSSSEGSRTRSSSRNSSERSSRSGSKSTTRGPKNPDAPASEAQLNAIEKMLNKADIPFDDAGFTIDGTDYDWDSFTMGNIQPVFDALK